MAVNKTIRFTNAFFALVWVINGERAMQISYSNTNAAKFREIDARYAPFVDKYYLKGIFNNPTAMHHDAAEIRAIAILMQEFADSLELAIDCAP